MPTTRSGDRGLTLGGVRLAELVHAPVGTPTYVYDVDGVVAAARAARAAFDGAPHLVAYAVKANAAGPIVRALAAAGCGADVVSGAELALAVACGVAPDAVVFSGVAKSDDEIDRAIAAGSRGIGAIQVESAEEIARVAARARAAGRTARTSIRVNPSVDLAATQTHAHIATGHDEAKFGVPIGDVPAAVAAIGGSPELALVGFAAHVGSQLTSVAPYVAGARALFAVARAARVAGAALRFVDTGGGFGIDYGDGRPVAVDVAVTIADFVRAARAEQRAFGMDDLALHIEPGRALVAPHGVLIARVLQPKVVRTARGERRWLMIDAGMNDLLRPALYGARHRIVALDAPASAAADLVDWQVVGPVCESADDFGVHRLPRDPPSAVAILDAGAYGYEMASRYNGRALPAEAFVAGGRVTGVTPRAPIDAWVADRSGAGGGT